MKITAEKRVGIKIALVMLLKIGVLTFVFFRTQAGQVEAHRQVEITLHGMRLIDAQLDENILAVRFGLLGNCDLIANDVTDLTNAQATLEQQIAASYRRVPAEIAQKVRKLRQVLEQKRALVEEFKSSNAVLDNSKRFFPLSAAALSRRIARYNAYAPLGKEADLLEHDLLLYNMTREAVYRSRSEKRVTRLCQRFGHYPADLQDILATFLRHAHAILVHKTRTDEMLKALNVLPTDKTNQDLYLAERDYYAEAIRQAGWNHQGLYAICLLLIGYTGSILTNLHRKQAELHRANDDLEQHVAERTQELTESQERFEIAIQGSDAGIWDWNIETNALYYSPRFKELLGYQEHELGNEMAVFYALLHTEDHERVKTSLEAHFETGVPHMIDLRLKTKSGEYRWFHGRGRALRDATGRPYRMAGSITDITERRSLETQLAHAQKMESIGQLAAGIAHEINTPIQYIGDNLRFLQDSFGGLSDLQREHLLPLLESAKREEPLRERAEQAEQAAETADIAYLNEEIPKAVQQSLEGVERVSRIVRAMKEFSHPGTAEKTLVDINHAIESTITVARNEWKYVAEMVMDFETGLPLVPCLPGDFNQVVLNLVVNAAHAIADVVRDTGDKGTITIRTRCQRDWAEIRIQDTGTGIPEAVRERIFDPFFTTKVVGKGTGQGLAIAHSIIRDKHGGQILFETELGKGTTFILRLPMEAAERLQKEAA